MWSIEKIMKFFLRLLVIVVILTTFSGMSPQKESADSMLTYEGAYSKLAIENKWVFH